MSGLALKDTEVDEEKIELLKLAFGQLTKRESQIVTLLAHGLSNKEIARKLSTTEGTIKIHLNSIATKLGFNKHASKRTRIAVMALRYGGFKVSDSLLLL